MTAIIAVDQGTTNTKAIALDSTGQVLARASTPTAVRYPRPGWVEQDADQIWRAADANAGADVPLTPADRSYTPQNTDTDRRAARDRWAGALRQVGA